METLELLGVALGLATLAGINLYLTVFVSGLAINQGWITLHTHYEQLAILGHPVIVVVAGVLFALEFFADKVPWVDSLWDAVHTIVRPIGGAMLAITVIGDSHPVYDVLVGLLAGGMALTTHGAKTGARLLVNASPEPVSNIGVSVAEDAAVLVGLGLVYKYPTAALVLALLTVGVILWFAPRVLRATRTMLWFAWRRVQHAFGANPSTAGIPDLPVDLEIALARTRGDAELLWAAPCVVASAPAIRPNTFGWLLLTAGEQGGLDFVRSAEKSPRIDDVPTAGWKATHRAGFVCDKVVLYETGESRKRMFQFDRSRRELAQDLVEKINLRAQSPTPALAVAE